MSAVESAIALVDGIKSSQKDEHVIAHLCGLLSVLLVQHFESRVQGAILAFGGRRHADFEVYLRSRYAKLNGRVKLEDLKNTAGGFGIEFSDRFARFCEELQKESTSVHRVDALIAYDAIILNRHDYVHKGSLRLSYADVVGNAAIAIRVLDCFERALAS